MVLEPCGRPATIAAGKHTTNTQAPRNDYGTGGRQASSLDDQAKLQRAKHHATRMLTMVVLAQQTVFPPDTPPLHTNCTPQVPAAVSCCSWMCAWSVTPQAHSTAAQQRQQDLTAAAMQQQPAAAAAALRTSCPAVLCVRLRLTARVA